MSLVLTRRVGESLTIGDNITVTINRVLGSSRVKLDIDAPSSKRILRGELEPMSKPLTTTAIFNDWQSRLQELPAEAREDANMRLINTLIHEAGNNRGVVDEMDRVIESTKKRGAA